MATPSERIIRRFLLWNGYASCRVPTGVGAVHFLRSTGQGTLPPLVAVHGFAASAVQLTPILRVLRPEVQRVVAVDLPAHGFSDLPDGIVDPEVLIRGAFEALDDIIREPVTLFGNSMGGYLAIRYALRSPEKVGRLVVVSPGGAAMDAATLEQMRSVFRIRSHKDALQFVDRLLGDRSPLRHVYALSARRRLTRADLIALLESVESDTLLNPADVAGLSMPVLCVWGKKDDILPRANLEFFRHHLPPHARLVEPDHLGHSPYLEAPRELAELVIDFVRDTGVHPKPTAA